MKSVALVALALAGSVAQAAIEAVAPTGGQVVPLVPEAQKKAMAPETLQERIELFREDRKSGKKIRHDKHWRKAVPFAVEIRATAGENGPWKVRIGKKPDLSDARTWYFKPPKTYDRTTGRDLDSGKPKEFVKIDIPMANLEIGTKYYWQASCRGRCGFGCSHRHGCAASKTYTETAISEFVTEDVAPRWIEIEGKVANIRDCGGRVGLGGRRVRQGMAYRGQGLNMNSVTGEEPGLNRLTVEDVKYMKKTLGIKTDLDLRGKGEIAGMTESPLGADVRFVHIPSSSYEKMFTKDGMASMARNFRVLCDRKNYPIYIHCIGGADRTGSLAYVMNGVLGVSRRENETDWESTFYPSIPDDYMKPEMSWCREAHFNNGFAKYGNADTPWNERIVLYLKACGITDGEIAAFREIMLEK